MKTTHDIKNTNRIAASVLDAFYNSRNRDRTFVVGINGIDCSGKTYLSKILEKEISDQGFQTQLIHIDDFHHPKKNRYGNDEKSPENYYTRSFNFQFLIDQLLSLIHEGKPVKKSLCHLNLETDRYSIIKEYDINTDTIVIIEGVFLYKAGIAKYIDYKIFLDIPEKLAMERVRQRDVPVFGESIMGKYQKKYLPAQKHYIHECDPKKQSQLIVTVT